MTKHLMRLLLGTAVILICSSCDLDTASSNQKIVIAPDSIALKIHESQEFVASGGYEYTWSLGNETMGSLSTRSGATTVYTSLYDPGNKGTASQTLKLQSSISGTDHSGGATASTNDAYQQSAEAYIVHVSTNGQFASTTQKVTITPESATLKINESQGFTASGGYEYTWSLQDESLGTLSTRSGSTTVYTSFHEPGTNRTASQVVLLLSTITGNDTYRQTAEAHLLLTSASSP